MNFKEILIALVSLAIGIFIGVVLVILLSAPEPAILSPTPSPSISPAVNADFDRFFIDQLALNLKKSNALASITAKKAKHKEIRVFAKSLQVTQDYEIAKMTRWYMLWYKNYPRVSKRLLYTQCELEKFKKSYPFENEFIERTIHHHKTSIGLAQKALNATNRAEIRNFCNQLVKSRTAEIKKLRAWQKRWYRRWDP